MNAITEYWRLAVGALLLREAPYEEMRDAERPFLKGLLLILSVTLLVALVAIVGHLLAWATTPDLDDVQRVVWDGLSQMPWYQELENLGQADILAAIQLQYETAWGVARYLAPAAWRGISGLVSGPVGAIVAWLVLGALAQLFARLLGGKGTLTETYGCLALAVSPWLLGLLHVFPYVATGGVVAMWAWICGFVALRTAHGVRGWRAFWTTLLPVITLGLLLVLVVSAFAALTGALATNVLRWLIGAGGME